MHAFDERVKGPDQGRGGANPGGCHNAGLMGSLPAAESVKIPRSPSIVPRAARKGGGHGGAPKDSASRFGKSRYRFLLSVLCVRPRCTV